MKNYFLENLVSVVGAHKCYQGHRNDRIKLKLTVVHLRKTSPTVDRQYK